MPNETKNYGTVITTAGAALIAKCILNGGKVNIKTAAAGDGGGDFRGAALVDRTDERIGGGSGLCGTSGKHAVGGAGWRDRLPQRQAGGADRGQK